MNLQDDDGIEKFQRTQMMTEEIVERLDDVVDIQRELEKVLQTLVLNDSTILDALAQMLGAIQQMQLRAEKRHTRVEETYNTLAHEVRTLSLAVTESGGSRRLPAIVIAENTLAQTDPEIALLQYLYSFLDDSTAIDVGANVGDVSDLLLQSGYTIFAFEPHKPTFQRLIERLGGHERFHALQLAIGDRDGEMPLHIAENLSEDAGLNPSLYNSLVPHPMIQRIKFTTTTPVQVRSLESLRRARQIPDRAGLLKIDTEGFDVEVINGLGETGVTVVMAEFWDLEHPFGRDGHGQLQRTVAALKERGFIWYIVIYHPDESDSVSYYLNRSNTVPGSWGNAVFFRDHGLFVQAAHWCGEALNPTLFR